MEISGYMGWVTAAMIVVLLAEIATGRHKGVYKDKSEFWLIGLNMALGRFLIAPAAAVVIALLWKTILPQYQNLLGGLSMWIALPVVLLVTEFCFYWVHRWAHEGAKDKTLLWMLHRTHHSARYMNVSVYMRLNMFWYVVIPNAWTMSLMIYLGMGNAAGIAILLLASWNILTHSHFRWDDAVRSHRLFGPLFRALEHVVVSPGMHHTHHGFGKDGASYRNYGVMLSVWDWAFGTLYIPTGRPYRYGLPGHDAHWLEELAYPLVRIPRKGKSDATPASLRD